MIVRCGACRTEFDAPGVGRHSCPSCGAVNQVTAAPDPGVPPTSTPPSTGPLGAPVSHEPAVPLNRIECTECSFGFVVGDIEVATCPNCSAEVRI